MCIRSTEYLPTGINIRRTERELIHGISEQQKKTKGRGKVHNPANP